MILYFQCSSYGNIITIDKLLFLAIEALNIIRYAGLAKLMDTMNIFQMG